MKRSKLPLILLAITVLAATGLFSGMFYFLKSGKNVNVDFDEQDLQSAVRKTTLLFNGKIAPGLDIDKTQDVQEANLNSAELTALANNMVASYGAANDLRIRLYGDSVIEASFTLGDNIDELTGSIPDMQSYQSYLSMAKGSNVYLKSYLTYAGNNRWNAEVISCTIGQLQIPADKGDALAASILSKLTDKINAASVAVNTFQIGEDSLYYNADVR